MPKLMTPAEVAAFGVMMESEPAVFTPRSSPISVGPVPEPSVRAETAPRGLAVPLVRVKAAPPATVGLTVSAVAAAREPVRFRTPEFTVVTPV